MTKKTKLILSFFYFKSIILFLTIFILKVNSETKIVAKNGDTLLKLSKQYRVSLKELMHKNNINNANKIIEGKIIIIPLKNHINDNANYRIIHKVNKGDTLYQIARDYKVDVKDIMSINNLNNDSFIKKDEIIFLPNGAINKKLVNPKKIKLASKKVYYHQTSKVESISEIAERHKLKQEEIISLNNLKYITEIEPNKKIILRKSKPRKWLRYGSLKVNWSGWRYLDSNYITQAKNKNNRSFYLAINCESRALNNTLNNAYWTNWYFPKIDFEFKLINDFCDQDFQI
tara:strand:+ start:61 stop:921 length:861 start_codon:yes stop_codon:yes gene_type:complete